MKTLNDDALVKLCRSLDELEADLRRMEHRLYAIRMSFREAVTSRRRDECGFVEEAAPAISPRSAEEEG